MLSTTVMGGEGGGGVGGQGYQCLFEHKAGQFENGSPDIVKYWQSAAQVTRQVASPFAEHGNEEAKGQDVLSP